MNEERGDRKVNKEVSGFLLSELPPRSRPTQISN